MGGDDDAEEGVPTLKKDQVPEYSTTAYNMDKHKDSSKNSLQLHNIEQSTIDLGQPVVRGLRKSGLLCCCPSLGRSCCCSRSSRWSIDAKGLLKSFLLLPTEKFPLIVNGLSRMVSVSTLAVKEVVGMC